MQLYFVSKISWSTVPGIEVKNKVVQKKIMKNFLFGVLK
jgi:hypothetical protein